MGYCTNSHPTEMTKNDIIATNKKWKLQGWNSRFRIFHHVRPYEEIGKSNTDRWGPAIRNE